MAVGDLAEADHIVDARIAADGKRVRERVAVEPDAKVMGEVARRHHAVGIRVVVALACRVLRVADPAVGRQRSPRPRLVDLLPQNLERLRHSPLHCHFRLLG
jgi:hypothetical protein